MRRFPLLKENTTISKSGIETFGMSVEGNTIISRALITVDTKCLITVESEVGIDTLNHATSGGRIPEFL